MICKGGSEGEILWIYIWLYSCSGYEKYCNSGEFHESFPKFQSASKLREIIMLLIIKSLESGNMQ